MARVSATFEIPGRPIAKQRARARNGTFFTPTRTRRFEEEVARIAMGEGSLRLSGSLAVEIHISTKRALRGDLDNYAKSILDGMVKGQLIKDDSDIDSLAISRNVIPWENDRTYVSVEVLS